MSDLTEFLLARVAEDERRRSAYWHDLDCTRLEDAEAECDCGSQARILAECEAKRRIMEECADLASSEDVYTHADLILHALALPYAHHPDCREEWRV